MASDTAVAPETPGRGTAGAADTTPAPDLTPPAGPAPTELAALEAARDEKRRLLEQAAAAAAGSPDAPGLPAGCTRDDLPALLQRYYWSEPAAEVLGHDHRVHDVLQAGALADHLRGDRVD
jgi:glutamate dehydrogenase